MERFDPRKKRNVTLDFRCKTRSKFLTLGWSTWGGTSKVEKLRSLLLSTLIPPIRISPKFQRYRRFFRISTSRNRKKPLLLLLSFSLELFEYFKERRRVRTEKGLGNNDINRRERGERAAAMKTSNGEVGGKAEPEEYGEWTSRER